ncbi:MAG TPA: sigma-70 family RNA polymerase sigma factor, partial [Gemmataceae bacterium]|nr:sigma-70 family RNA polymerase sigma factor [Gemmataceae bacterium]
MAAETLGEVLRRIGRRAGLEGVLTLTDAQLLERFAAGRDEPAFAALMVRHGPMVLGVCRRLLRDAGQAEDAFQAAFLVLARRAGAVRRRDLLSGWLYGVAYKVAARLRGREWKRQSREKPADCDAVAATVEPDVADYPTIHEEVRRLPDKYRQPVVLCYLEGKTHEEAARVLRWPIGTVKGRLARARDLLRSRLSRRGVGPCEGPWPNALAVAAPPPALVDATIRAAPLFAAGDATAGGLASARAIRLSQGVLRTMLLSTWKIGAALALAAALLAGTGRLIYQTAGDPGPAPRAAPKAAKPAADDKSNEDKNAIQGTWRVTALEMGGKDVSGTHPFKDAAATKWTIGADKITIAGPGQAEQHANYKLDPEKKPRELDVTPQDGPENEKGKLT